MSFCCGSESIAYYPYFNTKHTKLLYEDHKESHSECNEESPYSIYLFIISLNNDVVVPVCNFRKYTPSVRKPVLMVST